MCGRCFVTYHLGMILVIFRLDPLGNWTRDPRRTKPACWPLHCRDRQRESPKLSICLIQKSMSSWATIMINLGKAKCTYMTLHYLYLWLVNISHTAMDLYNLNWQFENKINDTICIISMYKNNCRHANKTESDFEFPFRNVKGIQVLSPPPLKGDI